MSALLLFVLSLRSVLGADCNYAQYKWVKGDGFADVYPIDVCMTGNVCCPVQFGSFIYSCSNGTGFSTAYSTTSCTGTPLFHNPSYARTESHSTTATSNNLKQPPAQ